MARPIFKIGMRKAGGTTHLRWARTFASATGIGPVGSSSSESSRPPDDGAISWPPSAPRFPINKLSLRRDNKRIQSSRVKVPLKGIFFAAGPPTPHQLDCFFGQFCRGTGSASFSPEEAGARLAAPGQGSHSYSKESSRARMVRLFFDTPNIAHFPGRAQPPTQPDPQPVRAHRL